MSTPSPYTRTPAQRVQLDHLRKQLEDAEETMYYHLDSAWDMQEKCDELRQRLVELEKRYDGSE